MSPSGCHRFPCHPLGRSFVKVLSKLHASAGHALCRPAGAALAGQQCPPRARRSRHPRPWLSSALAAGPLAVSVPGVPPPLPRTRPSSGAPLWAPPVGTAAPGHGPVTAGRSVGGAALGLSPRVALTPLCLRDSPAAWPGPASRPKPPARQPLPGVRDTWHGYGSGAAPGPRALPACPRPASPSGSSPLGTRAGNTWWFLGGQGTGRKETSIPRERPSPGVPAFPLPPGPPSLRGRSARLSSLGLGARVAGPQPPAPGLLLPAGGAARASSAPPRLGGGPVALRPCSVLLSP